jgi:hypothetical protein
VLPTLDFISRVFENVHATINTWCRPSRMGAAVTVLRNMAIASWYQVGCPARTAAPCMLMLLLLKCGSSSCLVHQQVDGLPCTTPALENGESTLESPARCRQCDGADVAHKCNTSIFHPLNTQMQGRTQRWGTLEVHSF